METQRSLAELVMFVHMSFLGLYDGMFHTNTKRDVLIGKHEKLPL